MLAAATAWDELAGQLYSTAASYGSVVSELAAAWRGPSSAAMATAAAPFTGWMTAVADRAEGTATRARAAAAAYETAFSATVPPPTIAVNRAQLMTLIATNFLGQNTPAIMATEAQYAEMWAQDAAAMYGYADSSVTASQLMPFDPPPRTTDPASTAGQAVAVGQAASTTATHAQALPQLMSAVPQSLQSLASPTTFAAAGGPESPLSAIDTFITGPLSPFRIPLLVVPPQLLGDQLYLTPQAAANLTRAAEKASTLPGSEGLLGGGLGSPTRVMGAAGLSDVSAGTGRADLVGALSVPQGWASAAPAIKTAAATVPQGGSAVAAAPAALAADGQASPLGNMAPASLAGRAMVGTEGTTAWSAGTGHAAAGEEPAPTANVSNIFVIPEAEE
jgi:PPE-repeat protein